ncbi:MAG: DEAD/DEAH box helicase [Thermaerobacter sp.]|nr:DEAD/DEAH box helicase [Thermaerobacter sp.]
METALSERVFHGLVLDPFQCRALDALDAGRSVLVAAPTGTGKTVVADYLIERSLERGMKAIYTAPIKALSNQKFREFSERFGRERIGIVTGDVVQNATAEVVIMTTEILRNMAIMRDESLRDIHSVIYDEIHFIGSERGAAWEESIIFLPPRVQLLGLSATIPNVDQLAAWMAAVRGEAPLVIREDRRAVPLRQLFFSRETGLCDLPTLRRHWDHLAAGADAAEGEWLPTRLRSTHLDLIDAIKDSYLPCLYFVFSRRMTEEKARELARRHSFLTKAEREEVRRLLAEREDLAETRSFRFLASLLEKGIGVHHAGLLPAVKDLVEDLYGRKLVKVLYCTETFSVGLNFPVKAVCFDSLRKFDGKSFRPLKVHEFSQMSGRAGRRGIDTVGYAVVLADPRYPQELTEYRDREPEALSSQFFLSYNTVLNLIKSHGPEDIRRVLTASFATFLHGREHQETTALLDRVQDEQAELRQGVCSAWGTWECPLSREGKRRELKDKERRYRYMGQKRRRSLFGQRLRGEIDQLKGALAEPQRQCTPQELERCRAVRRDLNRLDNQIGVLRASLRRLPEEDQFLAEFERKKAFLEELGYVAQGRLLPRGDVAAQIHIQEILVTEFVFRGVLHRLDVDTLNGLLVAVDFEPRRGDLVHLKALPELKEARAVARELEQVEGVIFNPLLSPLARKWSQGESFEELTRHANMDEGDIVSAFRRSLDLIRQLKKAAAEDRALVEKLAEAQRRMDRDVVEALL